MPACLPACRLLGCFPWLQIRPKCDTKQIGKTYKWWVKGGRRGCKVKTWACLLRGGRLIASSFDSQPVTLCRWWCWWGGMPSTCYYHQPPHEMKRWNMLIIFQVCMSLFWTRATKAQHIGMGIVNCCCVFVSFGKWCCCGGRLCSSS